MIEEATLIEERGLNAFGELLEMLYGYYMVAPAFFWAAICLLAWTIGWMFYAKSKARN